MNLDNWDGVPRGIALSELTWEFHQAEDGKSPTLDPDLPQRFLARFPQIVEQHIWDQTLDDWFWDRWRRLPGKALMEVCTPDECFRLLQNSIFTSRLGDELRTDRLGGVAYKIRNSMWRWGMHDDHNDFARYHNELKTFDFGIPGFEVRLDHVTGFNEKGFVRYHRGETYGECLYLDGSLGFVIYRKNKPVMVIGFSFSREGVLLQQVQLLQKKGNRWLYKLPTHFFEHAVNRMRSCFSGPLWVVDGESALDALARSYTDCTFDEKYSNEVQERIQRMYDRQLPGFQRTREYTTNRTKFHLLEEEEGVSCSAA